MVTSLSFSFLIFLIEKADWEHTHARKQQTQQQQWGDMNVMSVMNAMNEWMNDVQDMQLSDIFANSRSARLDSSFTLHSSPFPRFCLFLVAAKGFGLFLFLLRWSWKMDEPPSSFFLGGSGPISFCYVKKEKKICSSELSILGFLPKSTSNICSLLILGASGEGLGWIHGWIGIMVPFFIFLDFFFSSDPLLRFPHSIYVFFFFLIFFKLQQRVILFPLTPSQAKRKKNKVPENLGPFAWRRSVSLLQTMYRLNVFN